MNQRVTQAITPSMAISSGESESGVGSRVYVTSIYTILPDIPLEKTSTTERINPKIAIVVVPDGIRS